MKFGPAHRWKMRDQVFDARTRRLARQWKQEERERFLELLASDPILQLHDELPLGEMLRFPTERRTV